MRYDNPKIRDIIAAEYVLGTLTNNVRRRFESIASSRSDWKLAANWWSKRLHLLADTVPAVMPRKQVWQTIETRLYNNKLTALTSWWRMLALGSATVTAAMVVILISTRPDNFQAPMQVADQATPTVTQTTTVALLANADQKPGWLLSFNKTKTGQSEIRVTALSGLKPNAEKSFELWVLPSDKSAPISLGLLPQQGNKQIEIDAKKATLLADSGLAVSLEPIGGSTTGQPTGAVLYQGKLIEI